MNPHSRYWDAATASPLHPVGRQALEAAVDAGWGDPTRLYRDARQARQLFEAARETIAEQLDVRPAEVRFYPSGTAAAHAGVGGLLRGRRRTGNRLVHSAIEHSAVLTAATRHADAGGEAESIAVDSLGVVDAEAFTKAVNGADVAAAALISASHEVGSTQPVAEIAKACDAARVPLFCDASTSVAYGDIPRGWSALSASARKWGGPTGVGVLAVRSGTRWTPPDTGRGDIDVSVPLIVAAAAALRAHRAELPPHTPRLRELIDRLRTGIAATVPDVEIVGHPTQRLPHLMTFSCLYVDGEALVHALNQHGFAVSSGSACTTEEARPSHVLAAMGALTHGNVRISLHSGVEEADVERFLVTLPGVVRTLREQTGTVGL